MTPAQLEHRVLEVVDRVKAGAPVEDSRYELKSGWQDPKEIARRVAGHANAAGGSPIIWIIGIDERRRAVVGAHQELANWWPQVQAQFDQSSPDWLMDLIVTTDDRPVVALLFDTRRAPYVVKIPPGGSASLVPWREGTRTRSAHHTDLVRILVPLQDVPDVEVLGAYFSADPRNNSWGVGVWMYITPRGTQPLVIPFHKSSAVVSVPGYLPERILHVQVHPRRVGGLLIERDGMAPSTTISSTNDDVIIRGPGFVSARTLFSVNEQLTGLAGDHAHVRLTMHPVDARSPVIVDVNIPRIRDAAPDVMTWKFGE